MKPRSNQCFEFEVAGRFIIVPDEYVADELDRWKRAADEVERLRKTLNDHLESEAAETMRADKAVYECNRLAAALADVTDSVESWAGYLADLRAELEKVK